MGFYLLGQSEFITVPLIAEKCALSTGKLHLGGLLRNSGVGINRRPDMISVVYRERKLSNKSIN